MSRPPRFNVAWLALALGWCLASSTGAAAVRDFELLSINSAGTASGSGISRNPVVSSNGQYVAFVSEAANLVANDANGARDVFWRDRVAGTTRLVSRTPAGASGNGESDAPVMSADGRYVAFHSRAGNLVTGDTNGRYDVFVWDAQDNSVTLVSRTVAGGSGAGHSFSPRMSASGRVIAFASDAPDLAGTDTNGTLDAFARDLDAGVTHLVSATPGGAAGNGSCALPVISANGRFVAFASLANNLAGNDTNGVDDIFVRDLQTQATTLASVNAAGTASGSRFSFEPNLSADGRYVAFASQATNLVATPDTNGVADVFVRDLQLGQTRLASVNGSGTAAGGNTGIATLRAESVSPVLSADGTKVLFLSFAQDLVANDTNAQPDVFLRDHVNGTTTLISTNRFGTGPGNGISGAGLHAQSADGRYVAFFSEASNLGAADTNNRTDVFLRDLQTGGTKILSRVRDGGFAANGHSFQPVLSADGSTVLFATEADNLDDRDANGAADVFAAATTLPAPSFAVADVGVALTVASGVVVGTNFTATVTVTNRSANFVTGLVLSNSGPGFLSFVGATASQGAIGTDLWFVGDLAANASASATITLVATNAGAGAVAAAVLRLDQTDLINGNDTASALVTASFTGTDLILTGTAPTTTYFGSNFLVSLVVSNRGPATATAVVVTNADPGDVEFVGVVTSQGTVDPTNGTWTVGTLAAGASATFTATLMPEGSGFVLFRAGVSSALTDTHPPNDTVNLGVTLPNLPPSLRFASNTLVLPEDLPTLSFPAFLQVHPTESNQFITNLSVAVDNPGLFAAGPSLQTNGLLTLTLAPNANGSATVTVLAADNGGTLGGGVPVGSNSFIVTVTAVNDPPLFGFATNHLQTLEDAGGQTLAGFITSLSVGPGDESGQSVTNYLVTTSSNALFAVPPAVASDGTLTFTPAANSSGSVTVTVVAQDDGGTAGGGVNKATNFFTLTVTAVNDAPAVAFTTNNVVVPQDSGAQLVAGFATPTFGPADEAGQAVVSYTVSPNSAALFQVLPAISLGGDLTFTPAAGASGSTPVTVVVSDSGGTANGGVDLATNTFTITISAPTTTNFTWLGGSGDWHNPALWSPAGVPGVLDTATITGGTVQLTNGVAVRGVSLASGTVTGAGSLTVSSNLSWTSGTFDGAGTLVISTGATATASTTSTKTLRRQLDNAGTFTWTGGTVQANNNPTFNNLAGGVFDIRTDNTFLTTTDSSVRTFNNAGTVRKTAGGSSTTWEGVFNNTGTVEVLVGTLAFNGSGLSSGAFTNAAGTVLGWTSGIHELTNGVTFTGAGTWALAGATLEVKAGTTVSPAGTFALSGGILGGAGSFTVPSGSAFAWTAGTMQTGGVFTVAAGGALTASTTSTKSLRRQLDNAGTITWTGGTFLAGEDPTLNNLAGGVFDIQTDNTFFSSVDGSVRTFNNAGTLRKSAGASTTTWEAVLNNTGSVEVQTGTLSLTGSGLSSGAFTNAAGAVLAWTSGTHELTNGVTFTGPGTRRIASGFLLVSPGATVSPEGTFELVGGTLGGAGGFTVPSGSSFSWTAGTIQTGGVFTVAAGGALTASTTSTKVLRRQLDNAGTFTWTGGVIQANDDPTFNNQAGGLFDIRVDTTFFSTTDGSVRTFNNAGTVRKSAGATTTTWEGTLNNTGTVEVQTGTLSLTGSGLSSGGFTNAAGTVLAWTSGTHGLTNGVTFTGPGTRRIAGGTLLVAAASSLSPEGAFELVNGTLGGAGGFTVPAGSSFAWTAGTIQTGGVFTVAGGGTLTASTTSTKVLRRQLDNAGTFIWTAGVIQANDDPTFNNQTGALFDIRVDSTFFSTTDGSVRTFNNAGTLRKSAGATTTTWEGTLNNTGTVEVQTGTLSLTGSGLSSGAFENAAGATLTWTSGTHELTNGVTFTGPGTRRIAGGTLAVTAGTAVSPEGTFELASGTLGGAGSFTMPAGSQFNWTAGTMATGGVFTVAFNGTLTASTTANKILRRQLNNAGTFTWTGGVIQANDDPTFNNQAGALFDIRVDSTFFSTTDGSVRTFNNAGTLRKSAGATTTTWEGVLNNTGTVEVQVGTVSLTGSGLSSGAFENAAGATLTWTSGTHELTNGVAFTGPGTRRIAGGTLSVTGTSVSHEGTFELASGTLGGVGGFTVPSGSTFTWSGGTIHTGGVFTVSAGGTLAISGTGTKTLRRQVDNEGTVTWSGGTVIGNSNPTFNNQAGALFDVQVDGNFFSTTDASTRTFNNAGTLRRTAGTAFTTWEGTLNNTGTLELRTGTFNLTSPYAPAAGSELTVFIGGTTAGTGFARLVGNMTTFAGTLNVVLTNGFFPAVSNSFTVVDSSSGGSGAFTATTGRTLAGGLVLETNYTGGDLTLLALAVNSAPTFTLTNFPPTDGVQEWMRDAFVSPGAGRKIAVDNAGNIIVAGDYDAPGGEVSQRDLLVMKYQPDGTLVWSNTLDADSLFNDRLEGLALDAAGNVFLLGSSDAATTNFVTARFLANGTLDWTRTYDSGGQDVPTAIAVDANGKVVVTAAVPDPMSGPGYTDYVTIKYAANGDALWTNTTPFAAVGSDTPRSVAVDGSGDVVVTGTGSNTDYNYAFTVKIAGTEGTNLWTQYFSTDNDNNISDGKLVAVDTSGSVFMAADLIEAGIYKLAVVKYNAAGTAQWTNTFTRSGVDATVKGLAVDGSGNALLLGISNNGFDADFTTIKYDGTTGNGVWTNHYDLGGQGSGDGPNAITVNAAGDVFVTGHSFAASGKDYLTIKYSAAGAGVWTNRFDSAGSMSNDDDAHAVAVDTNGNVYVTGESDTQFRTLKYALVPSLGAGQSVANTVGAVSIPGFVVSSSVGTTNESGQSLAFIVTNDNNGLFSVQPAISAAGELTYTVNGGASGLAVVTVRAQDTGGTANGGVDTSAPQSFNLTVVGGAGGTAYTWLAAATGNWNDTNNWSPNGVPGVADTVTIGSGNAQVTNAVAVRTLTLTGGFISGAGSLSIRSAMTWTAGTLIGAGTTTIANGAVLTVNGAADKDLRRRLDNYGTVTWTAGRILGHDAATIYNYAGALFDTQSEATLFESGDGTVKTFHNFGTVRKSAGTGTSAWSGSFNNSGTVDVQTGTLNPSGTVTLNNSTYTGTGKFMLTGATLAGTLTIAAGADVDFASGTLGGTGTIVGTLNWTGGAFGPGGTTTIATNGALVISGATDKDLRHTLDNYGSVTWTGARILGHQGPVIQNRAGAVFDAQANTTLFESGDGTIKNFNNSGTVRRTVGTGTTTWNGRFNNDAVLRVETGVVALNGGGTSAGTFTNLAGATLEFSGGTHTLNHGATFTGAGTNLIDGGTVNVAAGATATATANTTVGVATGTLGGTGTLLVTSGSQFLWSGGTMSGTTGRTVITNGAAMVVSTGVDKDLRRVLDNYGTVTWTTGRIIGHATPTINNYAGALFDTQTDSSLFDSGDGTIKTFNNLGTVRKSGGTGTSTWNGTFNHSGAADVLTGTLNPDGAVTLGNSSYSGAGRYLITGATLAGTLTVAGGANVEISGSSVGGSGTLVGTLNWTSGILGTGGTLTIATNGVLVASGAADKDLRQTIDNYGTVTWTGGRIIGHSTPVIVNRAGAFFDAQTDTTLYESGDGTIKTFNNLGTVRRTVGTGTTLWNGLFNNHAVLRVETGLVALNGGGTSGGLFTNLAGTTLEFSGGTHTLTDGAHFDGAGTNLIDGGTVNVGASATATAAGTFTLSTGTLGGTGTFLATSGSQFNWTGGTMAGTTGITTITNGATLIASTGTDKDLRRRLDNYGTVTWTAGRIIGHATPVLNNFAGALLDVQVDTTLFDSSDGTVKTFNNAGTLRKSAGTGLSTLHGTFNHSGTANIQTGTLNPDGVVTATSASYSGAGRFLFTGGTLSGTQTVAGGANVELASGSLFGTWTLAGTMNWTGGSLGAGGSTTIPAGSTLLATGAADKDLRRTLHNSGTVLWTAGRILGHSTPVINNLAGGVFETQVAATLFESSDGTIKTFNNSGTVRKSAATGTTTFHGTFNNSGVLEIQLGVLSLANGYAPAAGSSLKVFLGGLAAGTQFGQLQVTGSTTFNGTLNIVLTNGFTPVALDSFLIVNSSVGGSGVFSALLGDMLGGGLSLSPGYLLGDLTLTTLLSGGLPPLVPQASGTERLLRWPDSMAGHVLETAPAITGPWTPVLAPVSQENGASVVRLPAEGTRFYRLVPVAPPRPGDNPTQ